MDMDGSTTAELKSYFCTVGKGLEHFCKLELKALETFGTVTISDSNACSLPLKHETVSYIVCDLPFGLKFGSTESVKKLLPSVLLEMDKVLVPKGRVMSDTDDTDVLLLIPPDFFNVIPSDSEDSFLYHDSTSYHGDRSEVERIVVNDLIDQVNELESRISLIETKENINFQPYLPGESKSNPSFLFDISQEIDSVPQYNKQRFSKSCSPAGVSTPPKLVVGTNLSLHTDGFCESLVPGTARDQHYESGGFTTLPNLEEIIVRSSKLTPEMHRTSFNQRKLELRDVDQLLDQMEATQLEIVQKLHGSGIPLIQDKDSKRNTKIPVQKVANVGDNISSVPNLGFGVRELFVGHSTPSSPQKLKSYDTRQPVEEDPIVPKTISPLGSNQINKSSSDVLTSDQRNISNASSKHLSLYTSNRDDQLSCFPETAQTEATNSSTRPIKTKTPRRKLDLSQNVSDLPKCGYDFRKWYHGSQESHSQPTTVPSVTSPTNAIQSHQQSIPSSSFDTNSDTSKHAPSYQINVPLSSSSQFNYGPSNFTNNKTTYFETHSNIPNSGDGSTQTCSQTSKTKDYTNIEESLPSRLLPQATTSSTCENRNSPTIVDLHPGKTQDLGAEGQKKNGTYGMAVKQEKLPLSTNVDPIVTHQRGTREGSTVIGSSGTVGF
uniref:(California timema) hypothetical protein n=1 Tax=Timema californicum TaxID=61474 RepID=A0A7R9J557_TIMCA|nr:unnamed protein product [Timema californicum]